MALQGNGQPEKALEYYERVLLKDPENIVALLGKGDVLLLQNDLEGRCSVQQGRFL